MSSVELPDGKLVPIQDTICECGHWHAEHTNHPPAEHSTNCLAPGCWCSEFTADPEGSTAEAISDRGGDPSSWPRHVQEAALAAARSVDSDDRETVESCYTVTIYTDEGDGIVTELEIIHALENLDIVRSVVVERH